MNLMREPRDTYCVSILPEGGPRLGRRMGLIRPRREPSHGLGSIPPLSALALCGPLSGPYQYVSRPCRSLSACRTLDQFEVCRRHADFEACRLPVFRGLGPAVAGPNLHVARRARQRHDPALREADDAAHLRVQQAVGQSPRRARLVLRVLQLVQAAPQPTRQDARDGRRPRQRTLDHSPTAAKRLLIRNTTRRV